MKDLERWLSFVKPYRSMAFGALVMLTALVGMDLAIPRLIQHLIDEGIVRGNRGAVVRTAVAMLAISVVSALVAIANNRLSVQVGERVARDLREALFLRIQGYSFGNLDRQKTGLLLVRLTSDVAAVKALTQISLRIGTRAPLLMVGSLVLMFQTNRSLASTMLPLLVVTAILIAVFVLRTEPLFRIVQQKLDVVNTILQENIAGARLVKAFVREDHEGKRFDHANEDMTAQSIRVMQIMSSMTPTLTMCVNIGVVVVIQVGGLQAIRGALSLGQIIAFTNYLLTTMTPLVMMTMLANTFASGFASLRRVSEILDSAPDIVDGSDARAVPSGADATVVFDRVSFTYGGEDNIPVLEEVSFTARPGQTIAILGSTGAGKSTLVNLVPRFYDATGGSVAAFGADVRRYTQASLAARIGVVPQESVLFSGTVKDNIRYGRPEASDADVERAARAAQAHDFVSAMPHGYDSRIEQRGANLSGGQKQRLAIARALLVDPDILILDDSTSAVDVETETKIQAALVATKARRTTFVVAQRISTVLQADMILLLDRGRLVASGTHRELLATSAVYQEIFESQLGRGGIEPTTEAAS